MALNLPQFLFVGTAKAGTTSIYQYLKQHPDISIPVKETFYFIKNQYIDTKLKYPQQRASEDLYLNADAYKAIYEGASEKVTGEIGTGYLYLYQESIPLILDTLGRDVKIFVVLRNPADRCFSSYMHFVKDLHEPLSFEESLSSEETRRAQGWDFMWCHKALGYYADQVSAFKEAFPNCKVLIYEEFVANPKATMDEIFDFIGVSRLPELEVEKVFNPSGEARNKLLQKFITHENPLKAAMRPLFRMLFSKQKRERMRKSAKARNLTKGKKLDAALRQKLMAEYQSDIQQLEAVLGRDLKVWS